MTRVSAGVKPSPAIVTRVPPAIEPKDKNKMKHFSFLFFFHFENNIPCKGDTLVIVAWNWNCMRPTLLKKPWRSWATLKFWIDFASNNEFEPIWQTICVDVALVIGHWYDDPIRTIFWHGVELKPVPVIVIDVPAGPWTGEIDDTVPIVHGVNKNCKTFDGTVCEHELGLIKELETHDVDVGTVAIYY